MKKNLIYTITLLVGLLYTPFVFAQNIGINATGATPDSSALLDIAASDKGLLIPRMTTSQRTAIVNPAFGLMVYDSSLNSVLYYNGTTWRGIGDTDNLGNHSALNNIVLGTNWLSNDGDPEGINIAVFGYVGVGVAPIGTAVFRVKMGASDPGFQVSRTDATFNNYTIPFSDGAANQVLSSNGAGSLNWSYQMDTDQQSLNLSGDTLTISNDATPVYLSTFLDNTDHQDLSLSGNTLLLTNDTTSVDLSPYLNTDHQDLSLSGNTLSLTNDASPVDLSGLVLPDQQDLSLSGNSLSLTNDGTPVDLSRYLDADNLGDHTATQNIQLNNKWLSNNGADHGIQIDATGQVGLGTIPQSPFHVYMKSSPLEQFYSVGQSLTHMGAYWQSFTAEQGALLDKIVAFHINSNVGFNYELYQGEGTGGALLYSGSSTTDTLSFNGIELIFSQQYTFRILPNPGFSVGHAFFENYPGGKTDIINSSFGLVGPDVLFKVIYAVPDPGFQVSNSGITFNKYTFPTTDGTANQTLNTDGNGILSWNTPIDTDNQDLSLFGNTLSLTNDPTPIDLSSYLDNTDIQNLSLSGNTLSLSKGSDSTSVDLAIYLNTDQQYLSLSGNTLSLTNDASPVDLSNYQQNLSLANDTLFLSNDTTPVDLRVYHQGLALSGNTLSLTNGSDSTSVDLSTYVQEVSLINDTLWLTNGGTPVDLKGYLNTDDQDLSLTGSILSLTNSAPVDLDNVSFPDQQDLTLFGNLLSLQNDPTPAAIDLSYLYDADNLGNHQASQNLKTNGHWLSYDGNANGLYVDATGQVGLGTVPAAKFHVPMSGTDGFRVTSTGVGVGRIPTTNALEVEGQASKATAGDWLGNSDARLKKDIRALSPEKTLHQLLSLKGVSYEWDDKQTGAIRPEGIQYGFTAQNIQAIFPSLVKEDQLSFLQTSYGTYDAMCIEAFRALNNQIESMEKENTVLKNKMEERAKQIAEIAVLENEYSELMALKEELDRMRILLENTELVDANLSTSLKK